jgi:hypothetical protein
MYSMTSVSFILLGMFCGRENGKRSLLIARTPSQVVGRSYDFFYLRCDYSNDCNVGSARTSSMYSMTSVSFILLGMFCGRERRRAMRELAHGKRSLLIARTPSQVVGRSYDFFYLRCDYSNAPLRCTP